MRLLRLQALQIIGGLLRVAGGGEDSRLSSFSSSLSGSLVSVS
jgi:hypothetical protein